MRLVGDVAHLRPAGTGRGLALVALASARGDAIDETDAGRVVRGAVATPRTLTDGGHAFAAGRGRGPVDPHARTAGAASNGDGGEECGREANGAGALHGASVH